MFSYAPPHYTTTTTADDDDEDNDGRSERSKEEETWKHVVTAVPGGSPTVVRRTPTRACCAAGGPPLSVTDTETHETSVFCDVATASAATGAPCPILGAVVRHGGAWRHGRFVFRALEVRTPPPVEEYREPELALTWRRIPVAPDYEVCKETWCVRDVRTMRAVQPVFTGTVPRIFFPKERIVASVARLVMLAFVGPPPSPGSVPEFLSLPTFDDDASSGLPRWMPWHAATTRDSGDDDEDFPGEEWRGEVSSCGRYLDPDDPHARKMSAAQMLEYGQRLQSNNHRVCDLAHPVVRGGTVPLHVLVAERFVVVEVGPPPGCGTAEVVDHKDGDPLNTRADNLVWVRVDPCGDKTSAARAAGCWTIPHTKRGTKRPAVFWGAHYGSVREAALATGVPYSSVCRNSRTLALRRRKNGSVLAESADDVDDDDEGDAAPNANRRRRPTEKTVAGKKPVLVDGLLFQSLSAASRATGIPKSSLSAAIERSLRVRNDSGEDAPSSCFLPAAAAPPS